MQIEHQNTQKTTDIGAVKCEEQAKSPFLSTHERSGDAQYVLKAVVLCVIQSDLQSGLLPHICICKSCQIGSDRNRKNIENCFSFSRE